MFPAIFHVSRSCRRLLVGLAACLWVVSATASRAPAAEPEDYKGLEVGAFRLEGVPGDLKGPLGKGLALSGESRFLGTRYPVFYPNLLSADLDRTRLFLARHGYPYSTVDAALERRDDDKLAVRFAVSPGPAVVVDSVSFVGLGERGLEKARKASLVRPESVFRQDAYEHTATRTREALAELGYAAARVTPSVTRLDSTRVAVAYTVQPGRIHYFGDVRVSGASDDLLELARKSLAIDRGERYNARDVTQARDDLRLLGLFRQVRVETARVGDDTLDVVASLSERDPRTVELGAGYWTDDGVRGHARWTHRNLLGGGRGVEVTGSASQYLVDGDVSTWWPSLVGPRTRVSLKLRSAWHNEDAYEQFTTGAEVSLSYRLSVRNWLRGGIQVSNNNVTSKSEDPVFLEDAGRITSLLGNMQLDTSDDQLYPTRGGLTDLSAEWSPPGVWTDNAFIRGWFRHSRYFPLPRRSVFAAKVAVGAGQPLGSSRDLIPDRRFFSGGATSHRGFQRNRLGPKDSAGDPVGGAARVDLSAEYRFRLFSVFEAAVFVDVGQVWSLASAMQFADLKTGVGPALMIRTPVGPIRADLGYRLSDVDTDEPVRVFHLLIGNPF